MILLPRSLALPRLLRDKARTAAFHRSLASAASPFARSIAPTPGRHTFARFQSSTSRIQATTSAVDNVPSVMPTTRAAPSEPFPLGGLLPKDTTDALSFLRKYPEYDGRNVRVAILDTGVDPAAIGLNQPGKVVDVIDCTGAGDVPLQPIEPVNGTSASSSGHIEFTSPFTGRTIRVSSKVSNPKGEWKIGFKKAYDLWPGELKSRRSAERQKAFLVSHQALLCQAQSELNALDLPSASKSSEDASSGSDKSAPTDNAKIYKDEIKARVQALKDLAASYKDDGPLIEAIVFHNGKHWYAIIGGGEGETHDPATGQPQDILKPLELQTLDLTDVEPITDFRIERKWQSFGQQDLLTYTVNIQDNGNLLSLVTVAGSHGTHVAGIVGARHDEQPELNGVAPGCEIVSMKIGDSRLGSMEQGQAMLRSAQALIDTKCDIANLSYGEDGAFGAEDKGAFAKALRDIVVRQRDVLFVSSAGNNGPALTTVGQPGGTTSSVLSVGAYVNAGAMQKAEYALVEKGVPDSVTTWCSRGPTSDGDRGVSIYAPGAAITSIPRYCLQSTQLMNGTSMSSPNACGSIALLLSGLKAQKIPITPARVFNAVRATGKDVKDPLGVPFISVDSAWDYLVQNKDRVEQDAEYRVSVTRAGKALGRMDKRGIYLREKDETHSVQQTNVTVRPTFKQGETEKAFNLELRCALAATKPWVSVPEFLLLGGNGRTFEVRVDPTDLAPGLHHAWIEAYDTEKPGHKLFDVPVTVAKPEVFPSPTVKFDTIRFEAGKIERRFISVPEGATWASLTVRSSNHSSAGTSARFWLHCVQLEPLQRLSEVEKAFVLALQENEPVTKKFNVRGGMTMEVCSAQFWSNKSAFDLDLDIEFHGITASLVPASGRQELTLIGGQGHAKIECQSTVRIEDFKPSITFDTRRTFHRPSSSTIRPLSTPRDLQPSGNHMFELVTTYNISAKEESNKLSYSFPALGNHLYDSSVPLLTQLFDLRKKRVHFGDVYKKEIELPKGDYVLKAQLLNESMKVLESLKNVTLMVDQKLSKPDSAALKLYDDHVDLHSEAAPAKYAGVKLHPGERIVLTLDLNLEGDAVPKEASPGDVLVGTFGFAAEGKGQIRYIVPPAVKNADEGSDDGAAQGKNENEIPELLTATAKKIKDPKEKLDFMDKLISDYPKFLGAPVAKLEALDADDKDADKQKQVVTTADQILSHIDETELKLWLATQKPSASEQTDEEKKHNKQMEEKKKAFILALNRKTRVYMTQAESSGSSTKELESSWKVYRSYFPADSKAKEYGTLFVRWSILHKRFALALQSVQKLKKELGAGTGETLAEVEKLKQLELKLVGKDGLDWALWASHLERLERVAAPKAYAPF
ncbi:minor extracellular protease [Pseudozyma hubeiensis SY62]|uniref:Tripeptidyl-peptidase 2 n=1 Tax=Pseudozyma hubeiensis (strain SY62) TaxID=1305764 RepID=R9P5J9_PSEHS|nr:minor extracellular protease [Pseudozyma hubeiensis SY62]GAC93350.1 minor extracellular protease [Pseudozyma hubeiensis SY62]